MAVPVIVVVGTCGMHRQTACDKGYSLDRLVLCDS